MDAKERQKDILKVVTRPSDKQAPSQVTEVVTKPKANLIEPVLDYENLTKNELVELLWKKGIDHNKRWTKEQLIKLLKEGK